MLIESFSQTILKWLRIPPGSSIRKAEGTSTSSTVDLEDNDYIQTILDITVDDICIGDSPLSMDYDVKTGKAASRKLDQICEEFNTVVKDIARDLCQFGYSVWDIQVDAKTNRMLVIPYLEDVDFYMAKDKRSVVYSKDKDEQLMNKLVFLNYSKRSLQKVETVQSKISDVLFRIIPAPMQLKNAEKTLEGIANCETSIARYRALLRPLRYANVDIGISQGDQQKTTIDTIASSINCNSSSLGNGTTFTDFDDNIPVLPNRKGLGKVEVISDIPSADLKDIADLEYFLNKLNLIMRFPGTYMDFSKALSESAVSMIRGDLRYVKLCKSVQTKIVATLNRFVQNSKFSKYNPVFALTSLPSSEDDDVVEALQNYCELAKDVEEFVIGESEDPKDLRMHRLQLLKDLFATSTTSPTIQKWFDDFEIYITQSANQDKAAGDSEGSDLDLETEDLSFDEGSEDLSFDEGSEDLEIPSEDDDVEILEPQSSWQDIGS